MRSLLAELGHYKFRLIAVIVFAVLSTIFNIAGPKVLAKATTALATGWVAKLRGTGSIDFGYIGKILLILLVPVIIMWIPSIINADMNFDLRGIPITPENNFFIQGFMGMVWFMIPASLVICTVLLNQTERSNKGILKMLSLPISTTKLCLAKFTVLILLAAFQMVMSIGAYYICAAIVTHTQDYNFILEPLYVCKNVCSIYAAAIPMAAVYLAVSTLIQSPIFSVGIGLASIVPSVLMINTKIWFAYPMSYLFYLIMVAYGRAAEGVYETQIAWLPWLPVAVGITILALVVSCMRYGASERR